MSCPHVYSDAAYVLGALCPAERTTYERHLSECSECASAVAKLAPMPGLLSRVDPADLEPLAPRPGRLAQLLEAVASQRRRQARRWRWQIATAALAATVLAVAGGVVGLGLSATDPGPAAPVPVAMEPVSAVSPIAAEVAVSPVAGGTQVWMSCWYQPTAYQLPPRTFRLVAVSVDGSTEQLGSWQAGSGDEVTLTGLTRFTGDLMRLELHSDTGVPLLAHELR